MRVEILDHGYVELVDVWGSDERIVEAARMSTGKGFLGWGPKEDCSAGDEKLLRFRVHLPVGRYSRMRASANLRNWLAFLTLRTSLQAQWEIRQYAIEVGMPVTAVFPRTHALFSEVR